MEPVPAGDARLHFRDILSAVERGERVVITRYKTPTAVVVPVAEAGPVVTEYGQVRKSGDCVVWDTAPYIEAAYPLAKRIENTRRDDGKVYRRRVIVVEDWTEVDE
jgi:prevent-host-death family protein